MERMIVRSDLLHSVGYAAGFLEVEFKDGGLYRYENVPPEVFHELTVAKSAGAFFIQNIKPVYAWQKLR